jgi:dephospho-CoA kinase
MTKTLIGMTGGIGCGKSTVSHLFEKRGILCIDADSVARQVVELGSDALQQLAQRYTDIILQPDGTLNRAKLRQIIFDDEAERLWVNQLLHPLIRQEVLAQASQSNSLYTIIVMPLLFESGWRDLFQRILVIDITEQQQQHRASSRDGRPESEIKKIITTQVSRAFRLANADDVIDNTGTILELEKQVRQFDQQYRLMAQQ